VYIGSLRTRKLGVQITRGRGRLTEVDAGSAPRGRLDGRREDGASLSLCSWHSARLLQITKPADAIVQHCATTGLIVHQYIAYAGITAS
jgi:hypothetical protein